MKNLFRICLFSLISIGFLSCEKKDTDFKNFLGDKEITYPGVVVKPHSKGGQPACCA
jgi:hypothetical protein